MEKNIISETFRIGPSPHISVNRTGEGETVFLLHGIGGNKSNWEQTIKVLSKSYEVLAWDTRGYGESDDYFGPFQFSDVADDLAKVLNYFGREKAHLIGLSMGARIACWFYQNYPQRVGSLVLCDTNFGSGSFSKLEKINFVKSRIKPLKDGKTFRDFSQAVANSLIGDKGNVQAINKLIESLNCLRKDNYIKTVNAFINHDNLENFRSISVPCMIMAGELDRLTPPLVARNISRVVKGSTLKIIDGAGHLINIEQPEIFNNYVLDFLKNTANFTSS